MVDHEYYGWIPLLCRSWICQDCKTKEEAFLTANINPACYHIQNVREGIIPDKKYAGYDTTEHKRIYKDDIDSFISTSEILIGKKVNNLRNREAIMTEYKKYKSRIPIELIALLTITIIVIIIGIII